MSAQTSSLNERTGAFCQMHSGKTHTRAWGNRTFAPYTAPLRAALTRANSSEYLGLSMVALMEVYRELEEHCLGNQSLPLESPLLGNKVMRKGGRRSGFSGKIRNKQIKDTNSHFEAAIIRDIRWK